MLITCFAFCFEMWDMIEECDFRFFFLQRVSLWIRSRDHVWSSHRLCFDCSTRVFSRWRTRLNSFFFFRNDKNLTRRLIRLDESDSSNLTRATHQTWYERSHQIWLDGFSSNLTDDISSNLMSCISSNLMNDISSNLMSCISSNLMNDISSNLMTTFHQIWWAASHQIWWATSHQTLRKKDNFSTFW
jgi:hypothetical protein